MWRPEGWSRWCCRHALRVPRPVAAGCTRQGPRRAPVASQRRALSGVQKVLKEQGGRHRVEVCFATARRSAHLTDGRQHARRRHALVPQDHLARRSHATFDIIGEVPRGVSRITFGPILVQGEADDDANHLVAIDLREQRRHWESFAGAAGERGEGLRERLRFVGEGETNAAFAPIDCQQPASRHTCDIVWKNSVLVFVRFSRSSRNSIASTGGMSDRKLRSKYTLLSSSFVSSSSSLRVLVRWTSIDGNVRRSAMRRSRITSELPVPLNSSKITSSMREPVSIRAVARIVSEPPPSMLRAAPKKRLGFCSAFASTPPDRILPECGTTTLWARPRRGMESSKITTSLPCSTRRLAFSITMSATWTWRSAGSSNVEGIPSTLGPLTVSSMSVPPSGRSSMSVTMR